MSTVYSGNCNGNLQHKCTPKSSSFQLLFSCHTKKPTFKTALPRGSVKDYCSSNTDHLTLVLGTLPPSTISSAVPESLAFLYC